MPLVLMPGSGSELYRGLGAAVLGALSLSTVVNMFFVPCMFSLIQDVEGLFRSSGEVESAGATQPTGGGDD